MKMNLNDKIHGFCVKQISYLSHLRATMYVMEYEKNGARLIYMDRDDENKTFSVAFKTLPKDNTGVFHILEHSVLCGSQKYPLKDPFVELLSGSLNTFLNAMTFKDKTMYPVATTNEKELFNLADVYLDAVFNPLAVKDKKAFMQEGWHYEPGEAGTLSYKGVVFSEMQGDYSSAESVTDRHINEMLFEGTPYAYDSGGDPSQITELSYEDFVRFYDVYYHPSNAVLFLDGEMNPEPMLKLISGYLSKYERRDVSGEEYRIKEALPKKVRREALYEIAEGEDLTDKARLALAHLTFTFDKREKIFGAAILSSALLSSNESPLKRAILNLKLCEDVQVNIGEGIYQNYFEVDFINVKDGMEEKLESLFYDEVRKLCRSGIEKSQLEAAINSLEFFLSERDYGSLPLGVIFAMNVLESFLYSDDALSGLTFNCEIAFLRENIESGFFEALLSEIFIENESLAVLTLKPCKNLSAKAREAERIKLSEIAKGLSPSDRERIESEFFKLSSWQESEDSEKARSSIPRLTVSDIPRTVKSIPTEVTERDGVRLVFHPLPTSGITYTELYFDVSDIGKDELFTGALLGLFLGNLSTENYSASELVKEIKSELGTLSAALKFATRVDGEPKIYLKIFVSALSSKKESIKALLAEVLTRTLFTEKDAMENIVKQAYIGSEESFVSAGHRVAKARVAAMLSSEAAATEYYSGYEAHLSYKALCRSFDGKFEEMTAKLCAFIGKYLVRDRLIISISEESSVSEGRAFAKEISELFSSAEAPTNPVCSIKPLPKRNEGINIPAKVSFSCMGSNVLAEMEGTDGIFDVASTLVSYEYLWGEVRVKGGAYGTGMRAVRTGFVSYYSYRDPSVKKSLEAFRKVPAFLHSYVKAEKKLDKYIIGAVGDTSPYLTPRFMGSVGTMRYLNGLTDEMRLAQRSEILSASLQKLKKLSSAIEKSNEGSVFCAVGPKETLLDIKDIDVILEI